MREITYSEALYEATLQEMNRDKNVFIYGIGVPDDGAVFGSIGDISKTFNNTRCLDMPLAEDSMMGFGLGAAINGLRPIYVHIRVDFLLLAMNQLANMVSTYKYMTGISVPMVIRAVIGRGWGQGMQHSKSMHSIFAHIPGLKVIMPTTAYDAKGLLTAAIRDNNPVICIEHRWLYWAKGEVPEEPYTSEIGKAIVRKKGTDLTIVALSWMNVEALRAIHILENAHGLNIELVDPLTLSPLDTKTIVDSVFKTKSAIILDNDWIDYGASAEIATRIYENCYKVLNHPIERIGFANTPCPTVRCLEDEFYPNVVNIVRSIEKRFNLSPCTIDTEQLYNHENKFKGPF